MLKTFVVVTILMFAAEANDLEMVQRLVENGADINALADDGFSMTALMRAAERGHSGDRPIPCRARSRPPYRH